MLDANKTACVALHGILKSVPIPSFTGSALGVPINAYAVVNPAINLRVLYILLLEVVSYLYCFLYKKLIYYLL